MKFTYKGTKCEILCIDNLYLGSIIRGKSKMIVATECRSEKRAIAYTKRFIDQIINAAKESGK